MTKFLPLAIVMFCLTSLSAKAAEVRELNQEEIRTVVTSGQSQDLGSLMKLVSESLEGELVDVRSFMAGDIFFQLTLLRADGSLVTIIVDGTTGALMPANSEQAKSIRIAAKANNANSGANAHANPNSNAGGNGNSGNNGNAGGNGGGNGNGNGNGNK